MMNAMSTGDRFVPQKRPTTGRDLSLAAGPSIDARYLVEMTSKARASGFDIDRMMARVGIDPGLIHQPYARIGQRKFETMLKRLTRSTGDEFWLHCSRPIKPGTFKAMCGMLVHCETLGEAIRSGAHFYHLVVDDFTVHLRLDGAEACVVVSDRLKGQNRPQLHGTILIFVYGLICWIAGKRLPLMGVHNAFTDNRFQRELEKLYRAPLYYDQRSTELRFSAEALDWPVIPDESDIPRFLAGVPGAQLICFHDQTNFTDKVRSILRRNLPDLVALESVSAMLAVSKQTLRRRLQDEGCAGFQKLKDEVRRDFALDALSKTTMTIEEIALALGFSEVSTFHRAFRRWAEWTPGCYRQTALRDQDRAEAFAAPVARASVLARADREYAEA